MPSRVQLRLDYWLIALPHRPDRPAHALSVYMYMAFPVAYQSFAARGSMLQRSSGSIRRFTVKISWHSSLLSSVQTPEVWITTHPPTHPPTCPACPPNRSPTNCMPTCLHTPPTHLPACLDVVEMWHDWVTFNLTPSCAVCFYMPHLTCPCPTDQEQVCNHYDHAPPSSLVILGPADSLCRW